MAAARVDSEGCLSNGTGGIGTVGGAAEMTDVDETLTDAEQTNKKIVTKGFFFFIFGLLSFDELFCFFTVG
jgi:hypothetical protein